MFMNDTPLEIDVQTLKALQADKAGITVLDVREAEEVAVGKIAGSLHIPLGALAQRLAELPKDRWIIAQCRSGGRSLKATHWLRQQGFHQTSNLAGGITAWAQQIDPTIKVG